MAIIPGGKKAPLWDTLPSICKDDKDVNTFKQMIVKYLN